MLCSYVRKQVNHIDLGLYRSPCSIPCSHAGETELLIRSEVIRLVAAYTRAAVSNDNIMLTIYFSVGLLDVIVM